MLPTDIRPAQLGDVDAMFHVRTSVTENTLTLAELAALGITPESIAQRVAAAPCTWVALVGEQVVGFAMVDLDAACLFAAFVQAGRPRAGPAADPDVRRRAVSAA